MLTQVTDSVFVGDMSDATDAAVLDHHDIERVVTLASPEHDTTTAYHPLVDGQNDQDDFDAAVETVRNCITSGEPILVHCRMGRSRSPTVVATALAAIHNEPFDDALGRIHDTGRFISPDRNLIEHARTYLGEPSYAERREDAA